MRTVYLDGRFVPESEAKVSIYSLDVMQSAAAFEMTRSFNGVPFKLREHLDRLYASCAALSIPLPIEGHHTLQYLCEEELPRRNDHGPGEEHRLLIVVSPGCAPMYRELDGVIPHPFVYIADFPLRYTVAGVGKYFTEGVALSWSAVRQIPSACLPSQAKHRSRLHFHLAQQQAPPQTWPLMLDVTGRYVTECPGANLIIVRGSRLYCANYNALPGISQQTVAELMASMGYVVIWGPVTKEDLLKADEVWISGTPFCVLAASRLEGTEFQRTVYETMLAAWNARVGLDIAAQIQEWDAQRTDPTESRTDLAVR